MISFYPGPSRIYDEVPRWTADALRKGMLSMNHRSEEFMGLVRHTIQLLQEKLNVPKNYTVFFTSSATECWEIVAQSLVGKSSLHIHSGAFGKKWYEYTSRLKPAEQIIFDIQRPFPVDILGPTRADLICLTQNETSNGSTLQGSILRAIRKKYDTQLVAVDATSSMGGIELDFRQADVWFASVQKCFGLPAGLALLICSPAAIERATRLGERSHYNSLTFLTEMMAKYQTSYTPNVLGIYLLFRMLQKAKPIEVIAKRIEKQAEQWYRFFEEFGTLRPYVNERSVCSPTVITLTGEEDFLERVKHSARQKGYLLGNGYGELRKSTIRIANFPAIKRQEISMLMNLLTQLRNDK